MTKTKSTLDSGFRAGMTNGTPVGTRLPRFARNDNGGEMDSGFRAGMTRNDED